MAAMAAVSARRMRGPSVTGCQLCWVKREISSGVQPPSGPMAMAWVMLGFVAELASVAALKPTSEDPDVGHPAVLADSASRAWVRVVACSVSLRRIRVEWRLLVRGLFESEGIGDFGDGCSAGLFAGFEGYAAPSFGALEGGLGQMFFGAAGEDGGDPGYA